MLQIRLLGYLRDRLTYGVVVWVYISTFILTTLTLKAINCQVCILCLGDGEAISACGNASDTLLVFL